MSSHEYTGIAAGHAGRVSTADAIRPRLQVAKRRCVHIARVIGLLLRVYYIHTTIVPGYSRTKCDSVSMLPTGLLQQGCQRVSEHRVREFSQNILLATYRMVLP